MDVRSYLKHESHLVRTSHCIPISHDIYPSPSPHYDSPSSILSVVLLLPIISCSLRSSRRTRAHTSSWILSYALRIALLVPSIDPCSQTSPAHNPTIHAERCVIQHSSRRLTLSPALQPTHAMRVPQVASS